MYHLYSYNQTDNTGFKIKEKEEKDNFKLFNLTFDSPFKTNIKENDEVYSEIFVNKNNLSDKNSTLLILLHGFASKINKLNNYYGFIHNMLNFGINCAFMNQPYHLHRTPESESSGEKLIYFGDRETLDFYHQAVVDVRRLIDIVIKEFAFKKIILCGFSLGSMVSVIAAAVDKRIYKTALLFGGGNWYQIHWNSALTHVLKGNCVENGNITKEKCRHFYMDFNKFCEEFKKTDLDSKISFSLNGHISLKEKTTKLCFLCDPIAFADRIEPDKIIMINSRFDHFFPKESTLQLWEKLGRPPIYWFNKFHTSNVLINPKAIKIIRDFITN